MHCVLFLPLLGIDILSNLNILEKIDSIGAKAAMPFSNPLFALNIETSEIHLVIPIVLQCFTLGPLSVSLSSFGCYLMSTIAMSYDLFAILCGPSRYHIGKPLSTYSFECLLT